MYVYQAKISEHYSMTVTQDFHVTDQKVGLLILGYLCCNAQFLLVKIKKSLKDFNNN